MRTSVCLCTFNGERYLTELLESLRHQSRPPDEVLVGDDGSSDGTLRIVHEFAARAPFAVDLLDGAGGLGPAANLERLLQRATGDVVLPCDQDDIWLPGKVDRLVSVLETHPSAAAAFSDSLLIDDAGRPLAGSLWTVHEFGRERQQRVARGVGVVDLAVRNVVASHALALRRDSLSLLLPFDGVRHADWWCGLLLAASDGLVPVNEPLVEYRQHQANATGAFLPRTANGRRAAPVGDLGGRAAMVISAVGRLDDRRPGALTEADRTSLSALAVHLLARDRLARSRVRRVPTVLRELRAGHYRLYGGGWRRAMLDVGRRAGAYG